MTCVCSKCGYELMALGRCPGCGEHSAVTQRWFSLVPGRRSLLRCVCLVLTCWVLCAIAVIIPVPFSSHAMGYVLMALILTSYITVSWIGGRALRSQGASFPRIRGFMVGAVLMVIGALCVAAVTRTLAALGVIG